jgi:hypothetical protein
MAIIASAYPTVNTVDSSKDLVPPPDLLVEDVCESHPEGQRHLGHRDSFVDARGCGDQSESCPGFSGQQRGRRSQIFAAKQ